MRNLELVITDYDTILSKNNSFLKEISTKKFLKTLKKNINKNSKYKINFDEENNNFKICYNGNYFTIDIDEHNKRDNNKVKDTITKLHELSKKDEKSYDENEFEILKQAKNGEIKDNNAKKIYINYLKKSKKLKKTNIIEDFLKVVKNIFKHEKGTVVSTSLVLLNLFIFGSLYMKFSALLLFIGTSTYINYVILKKIDFFKTIKDINLINKKIKTLNNLKIEENTNNKELNDYKIPKDAFKNEIYNIANKLISNLKLIEDKNERYNFAIKIKESLNKYITRSNNFDNLNNNNKPNLNIDNTKRANLDAIKELTLLEETLKNNINTYLDKEKEQEEQIKLLNKLDEEILRLNNELDYNLQEDSSKTYQKVKK